MKRTVTRAFRLALCALGLGSTLAAQAAYVPVTLTGLTADVIANGTGTSLASSTIGVDEGNYVFMAQDFNPTGTSYLPNNGLVTSAATAGLTYQLAAYTGSNSLRIPATSPGQGTGTGTVTFTTPQAAGEVYLLTTSGSGNSTITATVNFTDGTTQVFSSLTISDWYNGVGFAVQGLGRVLRTTNAIENNSTNPRLYQTLLTLSQANQAKLVQSVTINKTSNTGVFNLFAISINSVCTGAPTPGTPTATVANACVANSFTLNLTGASTGSGLSYHWQSSPAGQNTFTNLGTAQTTIPYTVASQTVATDYRAIVTCTASTQSVTTGIIAVGQNSFLNCYCTPTGGSCASEWIRGVTVSSLSNINTTCSTGGYVSYTTNPALTTTLIQGTTYPLTAALRVNSASSQAGVWIDYDHSGTFDALEYTLIGTGPTTGFTALDLSLTGNIAVPITALTGQTRMRVRSNNGAVLGSQSCFNNYFGEVEDYVVNISSGAPCAGTPTGGTATTTNASVCPATAFTLGVSGYSAGVTGLTFQWQSSPAGTNTYTAISGATTATYTVPSLTAATNYRVQITCTASSQSAFSTAVTVNPAPFLGCYCTPTYLSGGVNDVIRTVAIGTLINNTTTAGNPAPYYHDYSAQQPAAIPLPNLARNATTNAVLTFGSDASQYSAVWIDFNHNGIFDATEFFSLGTNAGAAGTATIPVAIPAAALLGQTKMRVRGGDDSPLLATMACGASDSDYGEAEDYIVNIALTSATRSSQETILLSAFPNPTTSALTVRVARAASGPATATLLDLTGKTIQTTTVAQQAATFDLSTLAAGIYLVRYHDQDGTQTIKVSKQ